MQNQKKEYIRKVTEFIKIHSDSYSEEEKEFIMKNACWGEKTNFVSDLLRQIYDEAGLLEEKDNIYLGFLKLLEENFDINQNILEVGGGRIPSLGKHIATRQKRGSITVYDQQLIDTRSPHSNLILKKTSFTDETSLKGIGLMIGFMPCEATKLTIKKACENQIDFMIALCDGAPHKEDIVDGYNDWEAEMIYEASKGIREYGMGQLELLSLEQYDNPYPIIYNKRKE